MRTIDRIDEKILTILQNDGRASNAAIAREVDLAPSAVLERIRKLRERGFLRGVHAALDRKAVGYPLTAFVAVRTDEPLGDAVVAEALSEIPEVLEIHDVAGDDCYLVKIVGRDIESLHRSIREGIGAVRCVRSTTTTIVLKTIKESVTFPLGNGPDETGDA